MKRTLSKLVIVRQDSVRIVQNWWTGKPKIAKKGPLVPGRQQSFRNDGRNSLNRSISEKIRQIGPDSVKLICKNMLQGDDSSSDEFDLLQDFLKQHPDKRAILFDLVTEFGLTVEVAIYALLYTRTQSHADAISFVFEVCEVTGVMQH